MVMAVGKSRRESRSALRTDHIWSAGDAFVNVTSEGAPRLLLSPERPPVYIS